MASKRGIENPVQIYLDLEPIVAATPIGKGSQPGRHGSTDIAAAAFRADALQSVIQQRNEEVCRPQQAAATDGSVNSSVLRAAALCMHSQLGQC